MHVYLAHALYSRTALNNPSLAQIRPQEGMVLPEDVLELQAIELLIEHDRLTID